MAVLLGRARARDSLVRRRALTLAAAGVLVINRGLALALAVAPGPGTPGTSSITIDTNEKLLSGERVRCWGRVAYDGTGFRGFQLNPRQRTVQGELEDALSRRLGGRERCPVIGASRTDSGVHARGQAVHFDLPPSETTRDRLELLEYCWNQMLPKDVRVRGIAIAPPPGPEQVEAGLPWHANCNSVGKRYSYALCNSEVLNPVDARWRARYHQLDLDAVEAAVPLFIGTHDFAGFARKLSAREEAARQVGIMDVNTVRTIHDISVRREGPYLSLDFELSGALYKMIRCIVGGMVALAQGSTSEQELVRVLKDGQWEKGREDVARSAPARGLVLEEVVYSS
jgi:tRNA pseudouridine38-40 synthase